MHFPIQLGSYVEFFKYMDNCIIQIHLLFIWLSWNFILKCPSFFFIINLSNCSNSLVNKLFMLQMSTSGGGGYCDCGDTEAWKEDPYCILHKPHRDEDRVNKFLLFFHFQVCTCKKQFYVTLSW